MNKKAVVLLSGGVDSTTALYLARRRGFDCWCLVFDYGQRHRKEIVSAKKIAERTGCKYQIIRIDLPWKGSSLVDKRLKIPRKRPLKSIDIPSTYVPSRNTIFLSYAASFAEAIGAGRIFIGATSIDFSGYPDCRPAYLAEFNKVLRTGTKKKDIKVTAPLIRRSKREIVRLGSRLGVPFELTWSCYEGKKRPCGVCDACRLRSRGFSKLGIEDPLIVIARRRRRRSNL